MGDALKHIAVTAILGGIQSTKSKDVAAGRAKGTQTRAANADKLRAVKMAILGHEEDGIEWSPESIAEIVGIADETVRRYIHKVDMPTEHLSDRSRNTKKGKGRGQG